MNRQQEFGKESKAIISPLSHWPLLQSVGPSDFWGTLTNLQWYTRTESSQHPPSPML